MKICLINHAAIGALTPEAFGAPVGGEEVQHALLARVLRRLGHTVTLISGAYGIPDTSTIDDVRTLVASHGNPLSLWDAMSRADADVYYYSCAGRNLGVVAAFARWHGKRVVFRVASDADVDPARVVIRRRWDRWLYHWGLRRADRILVQTEKQRLALAAHHGLDAIVADMLVDPTQGRYKSTFAPTDALWVSNIRPEKRPEMLLELARALPQIRFTMAGGPVPGHQALYETIEAEAAKLPNVTFLGPVPYGRIGSLFDVAQLFVNTSVLEGFPNTFLQAWVRGIPVVTTFDPDGIVERYALGLAARSLADMVRAVGSEATRFATESANARRFMATRFGTERVMAPYLRALIGEHPVDDAPVVVARPSAAPSNRPCAPGRCARPPRSSEQCHDAALPAMHRRVQPRPTLLGARIGAHPLC